MLRFCYTGLKRSLSSAEIDEFYPPLRIPRVSAGTVLGASDLNAVK
jgi:hypothetical protein